MIDTNKYGRIVSAVPVESSFEIYIFTECGYIFCFDTISVTLNRVEEK